MSTPNTPFTPPIALPADTIDDLIYCARAGDLLALKEDLTSLSKQHECAEATIVASAVDKEDEAEGGTGSSVLHFPAANGNSEILNFLLQTLSAQPEIQTAIVSHRNYSGNTPLHWAAMNTHLDCVKALVGAGADISIKNGAGLDAIFLAERTAWSTVEAGGEENAQNQEGNSAEEKVENSPGRQVVEWLLSCDTASGIEGNGGEESADVEDGKEGQS